MTGDFIVWHDITEQKRLERIKDDFLQVVAHELKNPLQVMKGIVQVTCLKGDLDSKTAGYLKMLETQIDGMTSLVDDLVTATRVTHSSFSFSRML